MRSDDHDTVNIHDAKTGFSRLIARVDSGERVTISRSGRPVARLIPYRPESNPRVPGAWRGRVVIKPDFDELATADERDWYGE